MVKIINKVAIFPLFALIAALFSACCKDTQEERYPLTPEDMKWNPYTNGQKLIFRSDTGAKDSFFVSIGEKWWNCDYCGRTQKCGMILKYNEVISIYISRTATNPQFTIYIRSTEVSKTSIGLYAKSDALIYENFNSDALPTSINSYGFSYNDVYIGKTDSNKIAQGGVYKLFFSKQYGFIRYDEKGGKYWELVR